MSEPETTETVSASRRAWAEAFGVDADTRVDEQVEAVVRQMRLSRMVGEAAADFGELLLKTLTERLENPVPPLELQRVLEQLQPPQQERLKQLVADCIVNTILQTVDQQPSEEGEVALIDLEVPNLPGVST